ncbi:hypothetical protein AB4099_27705 [Bosea sp. 2KB_26]|uniref:hypothetical protein n=1 Tax=Bosea sp. 2KB_26 TaxID=3237475 RepID=UPI003F8F3D53
MFVKTVSGSTITLAHGAGVIWLIGWDDLRDEPVIVSKIGPGREIHHRLMTLGTSALMSDDPLISLPASPPRIRTNQRATWTRSWTGHASYPVTLMHATA